MDPVHAIVGIRFLFVSPTDGFLWQGFTKAT